MSKNKKLLILLVGGVLLVSLFVYISGKVVLLIASRNSSTISSGSESFGAPTDKFAYDMNESGGDGVTSSTPPTDEKIIKNASIAMTVIDFDESVAGIKSIVTTSKGLVQNLSDYGTYNDRVVSVTIRVPAGEFDNVLASVKALATEVTSSSENSDDVTEAYQDIQARLKTQKALEAQLLTLLNRASKISDILGIQRELTSVRTEIEVYESQIKYYDSQTDMSTISIAMSKATESIDITSEGWKFMGVVKTAFSGLVEFGKVVLTVIIWAVVFSPFVFIPYVGVVIVRKWKKKAKK